MRSSCWRTSTATSRRGEPPFDAAHDRHPRDRVRDHRDDPDAGRGLRADRADARPHRAAVHRVRAGLGRGGAGLGLRGPDPDADDVLAPARAARRGGRGRPVPRPRAGRRSSAAMRDCSVWSSRRSWLLLPLVGLVLGQPGSPCSSASPASCRRPRTAATSGPRCAARKGSRSTGPRATCTQLEPILARRARGRQHLPHRRRAGGDARHRRDPAQALGGAEPLAAGDRADAAAAARPRSPGMVAVASSPPSLGPGRAQPAGAARAPDQRQLRGSGRGHRAVRACGRGLARHHRRQRRAQPGDAAARRDLRPAEDRRPRPERRQRRAHARELPGRPTGHALQPRRRAVRGHRAGCRCRPEGAGRSVRDLCPRPRRRDDPALQPGAVARRRWPPRS